MSNEQIDGGQAFPSSHHPEHGYGAVASLVEGMSLRDYFAGQALMGILAFPRREISTLAVCQQSYQIADALIAERNKPR